MEIENELFSDDIGTFQSHLLWFLHICYNTISGYGPFATRVVLVSTEPY